MVQTQFSCTIKKFCSDNAMEYKAKSSLTLLQQNGTVSHHSCPYTSQQNGRAKCKHRHILDTVRAASPQKRFGREVEMRSALTVSRI